MVNTPAPSLYWYDYETFGADPRRDRPAQFAGLRTDLELNIVDEPLTLYCRPSDDFLPHPEACLITGICPQKAAREGVIEAEFITRIHRELARPHTCMVGYNSIRFDDEVTRFTLYRNFFDAYAHEWQNGNTRWDILDMVRLTHALRPEGINWPRHADGKPSFRLEELTAANQIEHDAAHDALSDVKATIAMAKLIRQQQPRLYDFVFSHRSKRKVMELLMFDFSSPVLHVSSMYPAELGCIALVVPLVAHPSNKNEILVYDLRVDPQPFLGLDKEELQYRLFTRNEDLPDDCPRLPVKSVHINKCPVIVPPSTLTPESADKWQIDIQRAAEYQQKLATAANFLVTLQDAFAARRFENIHDPDLMLYAGGFFSNDDRTRMDMVRSAKADQLADLNLAFDDQRLPEMLFRYRARNYPQTLSGEEKRKWQEFRRSRLIDSGDGAWLSVDEYLQQITELSHSVLPDSREFRILADLREYGERIISSL